MVPLSEREQRLLEQMERALSAEDPRFASTLQGARSAAVQRRLFIGAVIGLIVGVVLLVVGVLGQAPLISVLGFVVMFAAVLVAVRGWSKPGGGHSGAEEPGPLQAHPSNVTPLRSAKAGTSGKAAKKNRHHHGNFHERMQQRWQRRRDQM